MSQPRFVAAYLLLSAFISNAYATDIDSAQSNSSQALFPGITYASIATERNKPTSEAPAVISVITAEDLHNHGITSLEQALEEVPGVYSPFRFLNGHFVFRGIRPPSLTNPETLLLVDGVPQNDIFVGVLQKFITRVPIANIKRIEVIRGPGSAVYGADAFAGVINIITKTDIDYKRSVVRGRAGSFDTAELDIVIPGGLGKFNTLLSFQTRTTDGHEPLVKADAQSFFDQQFTTKASLAPGGANTYFDEYNVALELFSDRWRSRLQARSHKLGGGTSLLGALTNSSELFVDLYNLDIFYSNPDWVKNWAVKASVSIQIAPNTTTGDIVLPAGAVDGAFPDGVIWDSGFREQKEILDIRFFHRENEEHDIIIGAGLINAGITKTRDIRNYEITFGSNLTPTNSTSNLPESQHFIPAKSRQLKFLSFNDDWSFAPDYIFSIGGRYDYYSDFGGTISPRLALIWLTKYDITTKLIANRAFRVPTLGEMYMRNNLLAQGNPDLDPAKIVTYELALEKRYFSGALLNISISQHKLADFLELLPGSDGILIPTNSSDAITGNSFEIDAQLPIGKHGKLKASYSYQNNKRGSNTQYSASPHHKIYAGVDWGFKKHWNLYTNIIWVNDFSRSSTDTRDDLGSSSFVGTVLRYTSPTKRWDSFLSVRNVFDEKVVAPSDDFRFLPNDFPLPGINFIAEVRYRM